jgi:hypothetical protein
MSAHGVSGVYSITAPDGKVYVGESGDIGKRWEKHKTMGRHGKHPNSALQASFDRHGVAAHRFEVVESVEDAPNSCGNRVRKEGTVIGAIGREFGDEKIMNLPAPSGPRPWNGPTKLTTDSVIAIKVSLRDRAGEPGLVATLAREHGIAKSTLYGIQHGHAWRHITI